MASIQGCAAFSPAARVSGIELVDKGVELEIGLAAGARDKPPFGGFDRIDRRADAAEQDARQPVLGDGAAVQRRLAEDRGGGLLVRRDTVAVVKRDRILDLRVDIVGERGLRPQRHRLVQVLRHAAAFFIEGAERVLRIRAAGLGGDAQQLGGTRKILRK